MRDAAAISIVGLFLFPIFWWGLNSIKPVSALFDKDRIVFFDFEPSFINYWVTFSGDGPGVYDARQAIADTLIVALGSTALVVAIGLFAAYALSRLSFRTKRLYIGLTIFQRFTPPIAIIIPIVSIFHTIGLFDTHVGLILMHTVMNLPIAILMLKSFFDEIPAEIDDAAMIDGASRVTILFRICMPLIKGGIAATAGAASDTRKYAGLFAVSAQARGDATPEDLEKAWEEELAKLQEAEVPERELRKVKNRVAADNYRKLESNMSLFIQLAFNEALLDWREINESPKKYEAVSAADIRRVARKYFKPTNRSVAIYRRQAD